MKSCASMPANCQFNWGEKLDKTMLIIPEEYYEVTKRRWPKVIPQSRSIRFGSAISRMAVAIGK